MEQVISIADYKTFMFLYVLFKGAGDLSSRKGLINVLHHCAIVPDVQLLHLVHLIICCLCDQIISESVCDSTDIYYIYMPIFTLLKLEWDLYCVAMTIFTLLKHE